jgi:hypothetical protein
MLLQRTSVWVVALLLAMALPRMFVFCHGPHCGGALELRHDAGHCCAGHHGDGSDRPSEPRTPVLHDGHGCNDVAFGLPTVPMPRPLLPPPADLTPIGLLPWLAPRAAAFDPRFRSQPATGPPRTRLRHLQRRSVELLV